MTECLLPGARGPARLTRCRGPGPTHLSLVLRLQPQPSLDAAPRLQEGLALGPVRQVADEDAGRVHAQEQSSLGRHLQHTCTLSGAVAMETRRSGSCKSSFSFMFKKV